jgi:hypothetical protein
MKTSGGDKMKAAKRISALVTVVFVLGLTALAQDHQGGNLAERQKSPTVLGGTGLFNTFSTRTLCKGEFNFALFWNNFDRDPGDLDINQVPFNFTIGITNRWELWVDWVTWTQTTARQPALLSGYQLNASRFFGNPFNLYGPAIGGREGGGAAFFPNTGGPGNIFGGILPSPGHFGQPIDFPTGVFSPGGPNGPLVVGLGPLIKTDQPSYYPELPFFGETEFLGFDSLGRPTFGPRESSNGSGDVYIGSKVGLIDPNKHWFSMALGGYVKIPVSQGAEARARGRTSGQYEFGPILMFGQESKGKRFRLYENVGYIHTTDPEQNGVKTLDLPDKLLLNVGMSIPIGPHVEFITEFLHTQFVGSDTDSLIENNPSDLNVGLRFYFKNGAISFGGAYRLFINNEDDITLPVFKSKTIFVGTSAFSPQFFIVNPLFETVPVTFKSGSRNGFVADLSIGTRRSCPAPPAPTCVLATSSSTVNRGERLSLTTTPTTPGYDNAVVTYTYAWQVQDAQGRPVTVSGSGASVEVPTSQLACGRYTVTTTVTAAVPAVDCPSECVTTGQTTCTASFEITEPPCPTVTCDIRPSSTSVTVNDKVTLSASATGADSPSFTWSTSAGTLSSTTGAEVSLDTTGIAPGTVTISLNVGTSHTRCDQPCPGGSCSVSITVNPLEIPPKVMPTTPCGPIFFPFNSARINNEHKACLDDITLKMQGDPRASVVIDGHRDSSERVGISLTRANNARDYLVNEKGIDAARITVRNFGDTCPHDSGDPNLNRRVEFWIVPDGASASDIDSMKKCAAGSTPQIITTETPAKSVERRRPARRAPRRRPKKSGAAVGMLVEPVPVGSSNE